MAWIYLAESAASQSHSNHGCEPSLTVNKIDTHNPFLFQEWQKESCAAHRSGMMCKRSPEKCCRQLTLFSEDSPAKTSALPAMVQAWKESEAAYFLKLSGWRKKQMPLFSSSKTSQRFALVDFLMSSTNLQKWGMTVDGRVYLPQALEPRIDGRGGFYLPTPTATDPRRAYHFKPGTKEKVLSLVGMAKENSWPTPQARDWRDGKNPKQHGRHSDSMGVKVHSMGYKGFLNPLFVEMMMGYLIGWSNLNALGIAWFHSKPEKHSKSYQELEGDL